MASRAVQSSGLQSAQIVIQPRQGTKIMFETNKNDVKLLLDKLRILD